MNNLNKSKKNLNNNNNDNNFILYYNILYINLIYTKNLPLSTFEARPFDHY